MRAGTTFARAHMLRSRAKRAFACAVRCVQPRALLLAAVLSVVHTFAERHAPARCSLRACLAARSATASNRGSAGANLGGGGAPGRRRSSRQPSFGLMSRRSQRRRVPARCQLAELCSVPEPCPWRCVATVEVPTRPPRPQGRRSGMKAADAATTQKISYKVH